MEQLERFLLNQGKTLCFILELIDLVKSGAKNSTATFMSFGGMVSIPVAFLGSNPCISFFYFNFIYKMKTKFFLYVKWRWADIVFYLQYTRMVFIRFDNFPNCFVNIFIFVTLGDIFWFYSTTFFNNVNIMLIESFCKLSFANYNFLFFNKWNIVVL